MVSEQPAANRITVNAAEQDDLIESVTVFQSNRAEIKRRVNLELKKGQNHVHIERLPSCINGDSIRVDGTGTAVIFDVVYHAPAPYSANPNNEVTVNAQRALQALRKERNIVWEQSEFLSSYGKTLDSKSINFEDVQRFLDMFGPRQVGVAKRIQELDVQIEQAEKVHNEARNKSYEDAAGEKRGTKITVTVLAETDGDAELMLTYVVSNASWKPLYDVRASIAKSPEDSSTVCLHYRASITQTTGENWPDVALTLSTASPQLGSSVPSLQSWRIGLPAPPPWRCSPTSPAYSPTSPAYSPTMPSGAGPPSKKRKRAQAKRFLELEAELDDDEAEEDDDEEEARSLRFGAALQQMAVRRAHVASTGALSATFGIPGRSNIPSDQSSHKVVIAVLDLQAELEWVCVPQEKESVFLTCKAVNSSEFTLLPGEASVFMDDNFVSKSRIEHVAPNDSFKTSLGADSALRVTYPAAKNLNRTATQSSFAFLSKEKQSVSAQSQRITIRNSRLASVSALRVLDHVPVSTDARIKVHVITPNGLDIAGAPRLNGNADGGKAQERPWTNVRKGVKARWAPLDVGGEGTVEWSCEIAPSEEVELELAWEVSAPVGQKWVNL